MPIIISSSYLGKMPFVYLAPAVVEALSCAVPRLRATCQAMLKALECYCHIVDQRISYLTLTSATFEDTVKGFIGALEGNGLVQVGRLTRRRYVQHLSEILNALKTKIPGVYSYHYDPYLLEKYAPLWSDVERKIPAEVASYWSGWAIKSRKDKTFYPDLACIWLSHGPQLAMEWHKALETYYFKVARPAVEFVNSIVRFLSDNHADWPSATFSNPVMVEEFFRAYSKEYLIKAHHKGLNVKSQAKSLRTFAGVMDEVFVESGVWARPFEGELPKISIEAVPGSETRTSVGINGIMVKENMLTKIPLELTTEHALKLIFNDIERDLNLIVKWARSQAYTLRKAQLRRKHSTHLGSVIDFNATEKTLDELPLVDIYKTFEHYGFETDSQILKRRFGHHRKTIAKLLGLPISNSLFPFQCLLVAEHPAMTTEFLTALELYNGAGQMSGFLKTDSGYTLVGFKDRNGKDLSEQKIALTPRCASLVRQVVEITQPLREWLKSKGDDRWRYLFLTCGKGFSKPTMGELTQWSPSAFENNKNLGPGLHKQFQKIIPLPEKVLDAFLFGVSLRSIRASSAVVVYLKTHSVRKMSEALGHQVFNPNLLSHYLPKPILDFFESRWVRIFQKGVVCKSMEHSPYILRATKFKSMADLCSFLEKYALREIPSQLNPPPNKSKKELDTSVAYIPVDAKVLVSLLSLEEAVKLSHDRSRINGLSLFWAKFSNLLTKHIENSHDKLLLQHLSQARLRKDRTTMEHIIYEPATGISLPE